MMLKRPPLSVSAGVTLTSTRLAGDRMMEVSLTVQGSRHVY